MSILRVLGHCQDRCSISVDHGRSRDGYVPYDLGIGGGDYLNLEIDLDTGQVIGWDSSEIKDALQELGLLI